MKRISKISYLLVVILLINVVAISGCKNENINNKNNDKSIRDIEINENDAKAIGISNTEITNISNLDEHDTTTKIEKNSNISNLDEHDTTTKIENNSNFYISDIWLGYEELDKNKNIISKSQTFLDLTLSPGELSSISFNYKEYVDSIKITSYGYETEDKVIVVNLKKDYVKIKNNEQQIENSKSYEILNISDIHKENESNGINKYIVKVKNSSQKNLGNITLKIGELKNGEYISVSHISAYNVLKASQETKIDIPTSRDTDKLKIIGYSYDDIKEKANIDIDLKSHRAKINK
ncbi:hypothetical protein [Romboutsia sp.]|uniref:hypothetical protein n=1 Tax=Romboutsia sp. TaxID=1965302 RepID=UPI002CCECDE5|nr:hypothetical protein [Romboutsia sp.]HSQ90044.1 hypothetical protein [Romboutsia sp.]